MEEFTEEHSKLLLGKEWLVKTDAQTSTPYLFKFSSSLLDLTCCVMVTDTKSTWAEVLTAKQFARRWRKCNKVENDFAESQAEDKWRTSTLQLITKLHTLGGIMDVGFEVLESKFSDLALELDCDTFKWRWETNLVPHKTSALALSQHLIMPLISVNHLAFSSADPVCELPESDLEKAVDKMGRTARRMVGTHVKHAIAKPRFATTLSRMNAIFNMQDDLPTIISKVDSAEFKVEVEPPSVHKIPVAPDSLHKTRSSPTPEPIVLDAPKKLPVEKPTPPISGKRAASGSDSATEPESDAASAPVSKGKLKALPRSPSPMKITPPRDLSPPSTQSSKPIKAKATKAAAASSDSDSSPARPVKRSKPVASSSDGDSDDAGKSRVANIKRGARQPVKRGGKRF